MTVYKIIRYKNEEATALAELNEEIIKHPIIKTFNLQVSNNCVNTLILNNFIVPRHFLDVNHIIPQEIDDQLKTFLVQSSLKEHEFKLSVDSILTAVRSIEFFNIYTGTLRFNEKGLDFEQSLSLKAKLKQVFNYFPDQAYYLPRKFLKYLINYMEQNTQ